MSKGESAPAEAAVLILPDGKEHTLKMLRPQEGSLVFLDIRDLHAKTGYFTFDPGFSSTGSCMSAITYMDGEAGVSLHRGYAVEDLCKFSSPMAVAHLLLVGELPGADNNQLLKEVRANRLVHDKVKALFSQCTLNAAPMAIMVSVVGGLSTVISELDPNNEEHRRQACIRIIAQVPTLAAWAYKTYLGQPLMTPRMDLSWAEHFLYMMFATPMQEYKVEKAAVKALNKFMILNMDDGQSPATSTVRIAGSSQANPYACVAAGMTSFWGPKHGGASEAAIAMLESIGAKDKVAAFVEERKAKREVIWGIGHRMFKTYDPRAKVMKQTAEDLLRHLGRQDPLMEVALELERICAADPYFTSRCLFPNLELYSGIVLRALGIPSFMFTVMTAACRMVGWMSHWNEMMSEAQTRINRPRQIYTGAAQRELPTLSLQNDLPERLRSAWGVGLGAAEFSTEQAQKEDRPRP